jgi:phospholipid/cholesterol/gamma-HCH transport system permease protein
MKDLPGNLVRGIGGVFTGVLRHAGGIGLLIWNSFRALVAGKVAFRHVLDEMYEVGVQSLPLVLVTATLSGIVTSQQGGYQFTSSVPLYILGSVVASSIILELAPVLTAIVLIGRVGARITAELGTMKVSEQIDALHSLGRDPIAVLAAPRIIACTIVMPLLVAIADLVGLIAGIVAAELTVHLGHESFLYGARLFWHSYDLFYCLVKGVAFGFLIPVISVHMGFLTNGGAEGVGRATTGSVVFMIIAVLVADATFPPLLLN